MALVWRRKGKGKKRSEYYNEFHMIDALTSIGQRIVDVGDIVFDFMDVLYEVTGHVGIAYVGGKDPAR